MYSRAAKQRQALMQANEVLVPLLGASRRALRLAGASVGKLYRIHVEITGDKRVHIVVIDLPASHPLVVTVYSSAQESRPTSPQQLIKRIRRAAREAGRLRGKLYEQADIIYVYLSPKGLTSGASRLARTYRIIVARKPAEARRRLAKYLSQRYRKLLTTVASRRIWGELPLLAYTLATIAHNLQDNKTTIQNVNIDAAVKGAYTGHELLSLLDSNTHLT